MGLQGIAHTCGRQLERVDCPLEVAIPVCTTERQTLTNSRFVYLDGMNTGLFEVNDLITERQRQLLRLKLTGDIRARERPVENRNRASEHTLHGVFSHALGITAPFDGDRTRAGDIRNDDGGANVARSVALHPSVLREDETVQLFAKVLDHIIAFRLAVNKKIKADSFLEADDALDLLFEEILIFGLRNFTFGKLGAGIANFFGLGERADGGSREPGKLNVLLLDLLANGEGALALKHVGGNGSNTLADGIIRCMLKHTAPRDGLFVGLKRRRDACFLRTG